LLFLVVICSQVRRECAMKYMSWQICFKPPPGKARSHPRAAQVVSAPWG
jgi:hypothetical protein